MTATLYRFYSATNELLYVGATAQGPTRLDHHRHTAPWFDMATSVELTHFASWEAAAVAEAAAIRDETPRFNVVGGGTIASRRKARIELQALRQPWAALTNARKTRCLSKSEAADLVGISLSMVVRLENGERRPSPAVMRRITEALGVPA